MVAAVSYPYVGLVGQVIRAGHFAIAATALTLAIAGGDALVSAQLSVPAAPAFEYAYERASFNPAGSSITAGAGVGGSLLAKMTPKPATDASNGYMWMNACVDVVGMTGERPTFQWLLASDHNFGGGWPVGRCCMYSLDGGESWNYFSSAGVKDTGNNWIYWQNATAFAQNKVRISESRAMSVHSHGTRLASLAAAYSFVEPTASAIAFTPTSAVSDYAAQAFIAAQYAASTDNIGNTVPQQPFYAFQINDTSLVPVSGSKKLWHIHGGTHTGEDMADFSLWYGVNWLCGNSAEAIQLRRDFRIVVYPMTTANGRAAGYGRGGTYSAADPNRVIDVANSTPEVTAIRNANALDFASAPLRVFMDYHGTYAGKWEIYSTTGEFHSKLTALTGLSISNFVEVTAANRKNGWYKTAASDGFAGAVTSITIEHGDPTPTSESDLILFGESLMRVVYQMNQAGAYA